LGDCLYPDIYHRPPRYTTRRLFPLLDRLLGFDATCYLAGHDPAPLSRAALVAEATRLTTIGGIVDAHGPDPAAILAELQRVLNGPIDADHRELVDAFLAGPSPDVSETPPDR
ncbi:MAG: hypothetical protein M3380_20860, partial [Chloroflexota bacterium]|nr:hypothetical protein [Chloroflexota bacterium]